MNKAQEGLSFSLYKFNGRKKFSKKFSDEAEVPNYDNQWSIWMSEKEISLY